jgi:hypothetical protein
MTTTADAQVYVFTGMSVEGQKFRIEVTSTSLRAAVAQFRSWADRPVSMGWDVGVGNSPKKYPVTRARWGRAYDGQ